MPKPKNKKKSVKNKANGAKKPIAYAFIDSQNLNLGTLKDIYKGKKRIYEGWKLDNARFMIYMQDKFHIQKAFLFIGYVPENQKLYKKLKSYGYDLIFKPTVTDSIGKPKGNVDAELVLHSAAIEFENYDKAIVVSGDGDFLCLYKFLKKKGKLFKILIPNERGASSLLEDFESYKVSLMYERKKLELRK